MPFIAQVPYLLCLFVQLEGPLMQALQLLSVAAHPWRERAPWVPQRRSSRTCCKIGGAQPLTPDTLLAPRFQPRYKKRSICAIYCQHVLHYYHEDWILFPSLSCSRCYRHSGQYQLVQLSMDRANRHRLPWSMPRTKHVRSLIYKSKAYPH